MSAWKKTSFMFQQFLPKDVNLKILIKKNFMKQNFIDKFIFHAPCHKTQKLLNNNFVNLIRMITIDHHLLSQALKFQLALIIKFIQKYK